MGRGTGGAPGATMWGMWVAARGRGSRRGGLGVAASLCAAVHACLLFVRERRQEEERRKERKKEKKRKEKKKGKNMENFLNLKISEK
jgi:hypothetical protein